LRRPLEFTQYASGDYGELLAQYGLRGSMSRRGDCCDNAVAESFFATLKLELVYQVQWPTRTAARTAIFEYLELFYNRRRRHSSLGYRSPAEFERRNYQRLAA
jgi:putative transposase